MKSSQGINLFLNISVESWQKFNICTILMTTVLTLMHMGEYTTWIRGLIFRI